MISMEVGESLVVPVTKVGYTTVRSYSSDLGFAFDRRYSTHRDRETRTYTITRIS